MLPNELGKIVAGEWYRSAEIRNEIELDEFVIMPNHIHGIVIIRDLDENIKAGDTRKNKFMVGATGGSPNDNRQSHKLEPRATGQSPLPASDLMGQPKSDRPTGPRRKSLSSFVAGFKSSVTIRINRMNDTPGKSFWQRNYYEHVIRDEVALQKYRNYIMENPLRWAIDKENPENFA
jgi:REP element-mobilizing transposase RayT